LQIIVDSKRFVEISAENRNLAYEWAVRFNRLDCQQYMIHSGQFPGAAKH